MVVVVMRRGRRGDGRDRSGVVRCEDGKSCRTCAAEELIRLTLSKGLEMDVQRKKISVRATDGAQIDGLPSLDLILGLGSGTRPAGLGRTGGLATPPDGI